MLAVEQRKIEDRKPKTEVRFQNLFLFFDFDDLTTFVSSGVGVDAMRFFRLARFLVQVKLRYR
jgi:hypothetical protein